MEDVRTRGLFLSTYKGNVTAYLTLHVQFIRLYINQMDHTCMHTLRKQTVCQAHGTEMNPE